MEVKKIKKEFYKQYNLNKKKVFALEEKTFNGINGEDIFFTKKIDINTLQFKIFIKNNKSKKSIVFKFFDEKTKKQIHFTRKQTNNIIIKLFNDKNKKSIFLHLLKSIKNSDLLKHRLKEVYNEVPQDIKDWLNIKSFKEEFNFNINIKESIKVLKVLETKPDLLLYNKDDSVFSNSLENMFDYYYEIDNDESREYLKKHMISFKETKIDLSKLHLSFYNYDIDETSLILHKYYYEKDFETINITDKLDEIIFDKINHLLEDNDNLLIYIKNLQ